MGDFFNKKLLNAKVIPLNQGIKGRLERERREFNDKTVYSEEGEDRVLSADGTEHSESITIIPPDNAPGKPRNRRNGKKPARKTRSDKGKRHTKDI